MKVFNRALERSYEKLETFETGIVLTGAETKSVFLGRILLDTSYVKITEEGEAFLVNADIPKYEFAATKTYDPKRKRKLLLHKNELLKLQIKSAAKGYSLIPVSCYSSGRFIKLEVALARGRRDIEKKKIERKREIVKQQKREAKEWMKK